MYSTLYSDYTMNTHHTVIWVVLKLYGLAIIGNSVTAWIRIACVVMCTKGSSVFYQYLLCGVDGLYGLDGLEFVCWIFFYLLMRRNPDCNWERISRTLICVCCLPWSGSGCVYAIILIGFCIGIDLDHLSAPGSGSVCLIIVLFIAGVLSTVCRDLDLFF